MANRFVCAEELQPLQFLRIRGFGSLSSNETALTQHAIDTDVAGTAPMNLLSPDGAHAGKSEGHKAHPWGRSS